ncbi:MAG: DNA polymerase III subunit delta [Chloroflexota bacterium]
MLIGEDDYSIRQALEEIKKGIGDATALMTNTTVLDGRQATPERLRAAADTVPFLAEKRLVIVEGLLERFEPPNRTVRKKTSRQSENLEACRAIAESAARIPDFTEVVVLGGRVGGTNPMLRALSALTKVKVFPLLKDDSLRRWIEQRVSGAGGAIAQGAVDLLVTFVGRDLWTMASEVDKLAMFAGERRIEEADVREVVSGAREANVFAMIDAIMESRVGRAEELFQQLLREGAAPSQLLAMLARQVRLIFQVKELRGQRVPRNEIQSRLGLKSDFVVRKAWEQGDRYTTSRLREVYHRLLETDLSIKTGKYEGELALNILIAELGQRASA